MIPQPTARNRRILLYLSTCRTSLPADRAGESVFQPITFWCDDVFATCKILKAKGVEFAAEPKKEVWGTMAIFKDMEGNQFVLSNRLG